MYKRQALVDGFTKLGFIGLGQILHAGVGVDPSLRQDVLGALSANTVDIGQDVYKRQSSIRSTPTGAPPIT